MAENKIELSIAGLSIVVSTPEDANYTLALAEELDADIRSILQANEGASVTTSSILCAIDYLNKEKRAHKNSNNMRNQIKDYLAEAAASKLEAEEEHRRSMDMAAEIQTLRSQLTRLAVDSDNTVTDKMKQQLNATTNELATLRAHTNELLAQNKTLDDKASAMSGLIARRDEEIALLKDENELLKTQIASRDETVAKQARAIDELSGEVKSQGGEIKRLNSELSTLENMILEETALAEQNVVAELEAETAPKEEAPIKSVLEDAAETETLESAQNEEGAEESEMGYEPYEAQPVTITEVLYSAAKSEAALEADEAPVEEDEDLEEEPQPDEEEPEEETEQRVSYERASLTDPVSHRSGVFDYDASYADEGFEQLDISMVSEASPEELEREAEEMASEHDEEEDFDIDELFDEEEEDSDEEDEEDEEDDEDAFEEDIIEELDEGLEREYDEESSREEQSFTLKTDDEGSAFGEEVDPFASSFGEKKEKPVKKSFFFEADELPREKVKKRGDFEERTVELDSKSDDDDDDDPDEPDLSWTLNI